MSRTVNDPGGGVRPIGRICEVGYKGEPPIGGGGGKLYAGDPPVGGFIGDPPVGGGGGKGTP